MRTSLPQHLNAVDGLIVGSPRLMWLFVAYDLPVGSRKQRRDAVRFHRGLENLGFERFQFSFYRKFCGSNSRTDTFANLVVEAVPARGRVAIFALTDKQVGRMVLFENHARKSDFETPEQLLLI